MLNDIGDKPEAAANIEVARHFDDFSMQADQQQHELGAVNKVWRVTAARV